LDGCTALHAARWGDIWHAPPAQQNAAQDTATKDRRRPEFVSICRQHSLAQTSRNKSGHAKNANGAESFRADLTERF